MWLFLEFTWILSHVSACSLQSHFYNHQSQSDRSSAERVHRGLCCIEHCLLFIKICFLIFKAIFLFLYLSNSIKNIYSSSRHILTSVFLQWFLQLPFPPSSASSSSSSSFYVLAFGSCSTIVGNLKSLLRFLEYVTIQSIDFRSNVICWWKVPNN